MPDFSLLRRYPDPEAENLHAVDATDRLLAEHASAAPTAILGDHYGALTLGAIAAGATDVRVFQDRLVGERALANNIASGYRSLPLSRELLTGATVVLVQLPKGLGELDELAGAVARWASPDVVLYAGGRIKHMSVEMNAVLGRHFETVTASLARQKSRVLVASGPKPSEADYPRREFHDDVGLWVCAHGGVFAGSRVDIGTRFLLSVLPDAMPAAQAAIDLGCGSGILAASLARDRPGLRVIASDQSWSAVESARATMEANGVAGRVIVVRDVGLGSQPAASADLVVLNPPFHSGTTVQTGLANGLFAEAARVLAPGGELWTVFNSSLAYRPALERIVGRTREIARNAKFTVTASRV
ncbi:MAG: SAM-dependent methyltransferase [Microbacteriaceae bacterium]|nr:SAM-dependent methyltransferase [Microbacteriaceae bacterium]